MFRDIKKIISLLNSIQIKRAKFLLILMTLMGLFELLSIVSIFPLIGLISNPNIIYENSILLLIYDSLRFSSSKDFIVFSGIFCLVAFAISIATKTITNYQQVLFLQNCEYEFSKKLFSNYINQPYVWILKRNSAVLGKNIVSEVKISRKYGHETLTLCQ